MHHLRVLVLTVHSMDQRNSCHDGKSLKQHADHTELDHGNTEKFE